jgi:hypothetical protein
VPILFGKHRGDRRQRDFRRRADGIASTVVMVAGAASTGGILAVCIGRFRKFFRASGLGLFQKTKEK